MSQEIIHLIEREKKIAAFVSKYGELTYVVVHPGLTNLTVYRFGVDAVRYWRHIYHRKMKRIKQNRS